MVALSLLHLAPPVALEGFEGGSPRERLVYILFRGLHATGVKKMGAHGHDEPFYVHAKHMYNLDRMKHQKVKMSLGVLAAFSIGVGVPVYAVIFQQRKTASG
ncbi:hypothetical protein KFK09_007080 [Dendrobium nobile]|uniref:SLL1 protein n=1 Tax=Dendrobium nobile TaxID=94219 RepID=A0A8T3BU60_DENNO|nr:hypothetical protein KFK09_007080 [Dendrobium nobile]